MAHTVFNEKVVEDLELALQKAIEIKNEADKQWIFEHIRIGQEMRRRRRISGVSVRGLGAKHGCSQSWLADMENGRVEWSLEWVALYEQEMAAAMEAKNTKELVYVGSFFTGYAFANTFDTEEAAAAFIKGVQELSSTCDDREDYAVLEKELYTEDITEYGIAADYMKTAIEELKAKGET